MMPSGWQESHSWKLSLCHFLKKQRKHKKAAAATAAGVRVASVSKMALRGVKVTEEVWLTCLTHALSTETEEIMGLLLGDIQVCGRRVLALFLLHCRCLLPAVCISIVWTKLITDVCCMGSRNSRLQGFWQTFFPLWTLGYRFDVQVCRKSCCFSSSSHWIPIIRVWSSLPVAYLFTKILRLLIEFRFLGFGAHYLLHMFTKILGGRIFINRYFWFNE